MQVGEVVEVGEVAHVGEVTEAGEVAVVGEVMMMGEIASVAWVGMSSRCRGWGGGVPAWVGDVVAKVVRGEAEREVDQGGEECGGAWGVMSFGEQGERLQEGGAGGTHQAE